VTSVPKYLSPLVDLDDRLVFCKSESVSTGKFTYFLSIRSTVHDLKTTEPIAADFDTGTSSPLTPLAYPATPRRPSDSLRQQSRRHEVKLPQKDLFGGNFRDDSLLITMYHQLRAMKKKRTASSTLSESRVLTPWHRRVHSTET
jgi:hypothetical protein